MRAFLDTYDETGESIKPVVALSASFVFDEGHGEVFEIVLSDQDGGEMQAIFIERKDIERGLELTQHRVDK